MLAGGKLLDDVLDVSGLTMRNEVQKDRPEARGANRALKFIRRR